MAHKCFISFKTEDHLYKKAIQETMHLDIVDKSLNEPIDSDDEDYIMRRIRENYLTDSTVTIHLIGQRSAENIGYDEQRYIKRELQGSLYDGEYNTRNGILGIVLPHAYDDIYKGTYQCLCGGQHNSVAINHDTVVHEFSYNYYIPHDKCAHGEDDRYCVLVKWDDFALSPAEYIEQAYQKREHPIASKIRVKPKKL
jgi:hypothetical protein